MKFLTVAFLMSMSVFAHAGEKGNGAFGGMDKFFENNKEFICNQAFENSSKFADEILYIKIGHEEATFRRSEVLAACCVDNDEEVACQEI